MAKRNVQQETGTQKPGCNKNSHILHMIFCLFLFFGLAASIGKGEINGLEVFFLVYSIVGLFYSFFQVLKLEKVEKKEKVIEQFRQMDSVVLSLAKKNKGYLTPSILSIEATVAVEEAKKILDTYVERGIAQVEVTEEGIFKYIFPELLEK